MGEEGGFVYKWIIPEEKTTIFYNSKKALNAATSMSAIYNNGYINCKITDILNVNSIKFYFLAIFT